MGWFGTAQPSTAAKVAQGRRVCKSGGNSSVAVDLAIDGTQASPTTPTPSLSA